MYLIVVLFISSIASCKKFLDEKPDKALLIPSTLEQLQALLDNNERMNRNSPIAGVASSDDYYMTTSDFNASNERTKSMYLWDKEIIYDAFPNDWSNAYMPVFFSNLVLESLESISRTAENAITYDQIKGSALLYRAKSFLVTVLIWSKIYDKTTAHEDLGIPLRLHTDFNKVSKRSSVKEVYDKILQDLVEASNLLQVTPAHVMRPSKPAAYALLSRTYLAMRDYKNAGFYADSTLKIKNVLIDFNSLNHSAPFPFVRFNNEVIMHFGMSGLSELSNRIDTTLYKSYDSLDLRKTAFFRRNNDGTYGFKGSYDGSNTLFSGLAVNELYLNRAEAFAREGNVVEALKDLNTLLIKRYKTGRFVPVTANSANEALQKILLERRKELLLRDLRWMDIKRLNKEEAGIILTRFINNKIYQLEPNDPRYALPFPAAVILLTGMEQNPR